MVSIVLRGVVTSDGKLEIDLPPDLPVGPVEVEIRSQKMDGVTLGELLQSGLVGIWEDRSDIDDSVEFARQLRRRASQDQSKN